MGVVVRKVCGEEVCGGGCCVWGGGAGCGVGGFGGVGLGAWLYGCGVLGAGFCGCWILGAGFCVLGSGC